MIKVHLKTATGHTEHLWATSAGDHIVRIDNIPVFTTAFSCGDLVRVDDEQTVIEVLERRSRTKHAGYDRSGSKKRVERRGKKLMKYLEGFGIKVEGIVVGFFGLAVPPDIDDDRLAAIIEASPVPVKLLELVGGATFEEGVDE
jgi:hypothetical protein